MSLRRTFMNLLAQEDVNFLLTNRIPRIQATHLMGWLSRVESPWFTRVCIAIWRLFTELDLSEARQTSFRSLHECFTRELKPGARPLDPDPSALLSPCDGIVGACGRVVDGRLYQAKGFPYRIEELFGDSVSHGGGFHRGHEELGGAGSSRAFRNGVFVTLRLTSAMYHRFHAMSDGRIQGVTYISGDTWNVNPIALKRVERLFCRNERVVIRCRLHEDDQPTAIVAVAAVLVASVRLHCLGSRLHLRYRGPNRIDCDEGVARGQELGWFEHGSTLVVFAPSGFELAAGVACGQRMKMGQRLLVRSGSR